MATACLTLACLLPEPTAHAAEPEADGLSWDDARWRRFHVAEYVVTATMLVGVGIGLFVVPQRADVWQGGILFDDWMRERLVLEHRGDRETAVLIGDVFYWGLTAFPVVADLGVAALAVHQSTDVAWQMFLIDAQAFAFTGLVSTYTQKLVGRNRPYVDHCAADPGYDPECDDEEVRSQSLISGHTAMAFTGAGLVCVHHVHLSLYGGGAPDVIACSMALAGATVVGYSRVVSDRHYVSDVMAGAVVGLVSGYLVPELLHYRFGSPSTLESAHVSATILPLVAPTATGVAVVGYF